MFNASQGRLFWIHKDIFQHSSYLNNFISFYWSLECFICNILSDIYHEKVHLHKIHLHLVYEKFISENITK